MPQKRDVRSRYTTCLKSRVPTTGRIYTVSEMLPAAPQPSSLLAMIQLTSTVFLLDSDGILLYNSIYHSSYKGISVTFT